MQRRAAAVYFTLFVLIGAGAFGFIQVGMSAPHVEFEGATQYAQGDTLTVDGRTYTVSNITAKQSESGGHGGGGGTKVVGKLQWTNDSVRSTATLNSGESTTYKGDDYTVRIANGSNTVTLVEDQNVSAILAADSTVEDEVLTQGDTDYVRYVANGTIKPLSAYLPEPKTVTFQVGDGYRYATDGGNVTATVTTVTNSSATLAWTTSETNTIDLSEGGNVTLNGQQYFVHFPSEERVQILPTDEYYQSYQHQLEEIDYHQERKNGVWGIVILSFLTAIVLLGTAYLPVK